MKAKKVLKEKWRNEENSQESFRHCQGKTAQVPGVEWKKGEDRRRVNQERFDQK